MIPRGRDSELEHVREEDSAARVRVVGVHRVARLQSEAAPGTILCGYRTYALVRDRVRAVQREPLTIKGAARPVEAWEILDVSEGQPSSE